MRNNLPYVMVLGTLLLAGCGSKSDANVKDLSDGRVSQPLNFRVPVPSRGSKGPEVGLYLFSKII